MKGTCTIYDIEGEHFSFEYTTISEMFEQLRVYFPNWIRVELFNSEGKHVGNIDWTSLV